jgi:preprotein translocase subunit SecF
MMFENQTIRFMRFRKPMAIMSLLVVLAGVVSLFVKGLNLGQDFTGGTSVELTFAQPVEQMAGPEQPGSGRLS